MHQDWRRNSRKTQKSECEWLKIACECESTCNKVQEQSHGMIGTFDENKLIVVGELRIEANRKWENWTNRVNLNE